MTLKNYLQKNSVTCSVSEFITFTKRNRATIAKYFKHERQMIDAYINEWKNRK
jgi:hypothetical protein